MPIPEEELRDLPVANGLSSMELEELATHFDASEFAPATLIMKEHDAPDHPLYALLQGTVEVLKVGSDGRDHTISTLSAPSVFGEIEVLARRRAIASVRSTSHVKIAVLRRGVFDELVEAKRSCILKVCFNLAQTLAFRLAATDERMAAYFDAGHPDAGALPTMRSVLFTHPDR